MFDPENLFRDPRILRLLSYKQPDLRTRNHRSKSSFLPKNLLLKRASAPYFLAFYHVCSTRA